MYLKDVEVLIINSEFFKNNASNGGAIYADTRT